MSSQASVEQIAAELRQGYDNGGIGAVDALSKRLADTIEVWHEPPIPFDGPMAAEAVIKARTMEVEAFSKALPDYREVGHIVVDGDDIIHDMNISGTYKGKPVNLTLPCRWTVENGVITRMGSYITGETKIIMEIFAANGMAPPDLDLPT